MKAGGGRAMGKTKSVNREKNAYYIRVFFRKPWDEIAKGLHFSGHSAVIKAAKSQVRRTSYKYAIRNDMPWPPITKERS